MRDHFNELYEWDECGNRRKKKQVLPDGGRLHVTMQMMDAAAGFHHTFSDGSIDHSHWSRPGFRVLDTNDAMKLAADAAYEERRTRMSNAWCKDKDRQDPIRDHGSRQPALDELEAAAKKAYEERSARMQTAWKDHHA
jgi:hypothetical protein